MINGIGTGSAKRSYYPGGSTSLTVKIPPVPQMRTKGQCKLSEKELVEKIVKLAKSDAAAGKDSRHGERVSGFKARIGTSEWRKLRDDFISLSSPNRMGIIKNKLSDLAGKASTMKLRSKGRISFFSLIFDNCKKLGSDVGGNFVVFRDEQGNEIARYSEPNGWTMWSTPAESARSNLFDDLWNQALADAQEELEWEAKGEMDILV